MDDHEEAYRLRTLIAELEKKCNSELDSTYANTMHRLGQHHAYREILKFIKEKKELYNG